MEKKYDSWAMHHDMGVLHHMIKHGYDKALELALGCGDDIAFIESRKGKSREELIAESHQIATTMHNSK